MRLLSTVRGRATIAATVVVAVALVIAVFVFTEVVRADLKASLDRSVRQQLSGPISLIASGTDPQVVADRSAGDVLLQIQTTDGRLVAATGIGNTRPVAAPIGRFRTSPVTNASGETESIRLLAETAIAPGGQQFVLVSGQELGDLNQRVDTVRSTLLTGTPVLLAVIAVITWLVLGRALRPVEAIRRQVDDITAADLDRRVPVPPADDEIGRLAKTMNRMLDRLQRAAARQREFTSDASHELKGPIANIRTQLEVASRENRDPLWSSVADSVISENERLQQIVDDLLFLAHNDERTAARPTTTVHLDDLVFDEAERLQRRGKVRVDASGVGPADLRGDAPALARLLRNLTDNAERHANGAVELSTRSDSEGVALLVGDDGPGISPEDRVRIFERFTRLDDARSRDKGGSGLGLAIVADIAAAHGGEVVVGESRLGGAQFEVRFVEKGEGVSVGRAG